MEIITLPVDDVKLWEKNARIHTKKNLDTLKASLTNFTQTRPIIVQKSSKRIIAGNGTYMAAKALGWKEIVCNLVDMDDEKAEAYAIVDNRSALLSQWDDKILTESLMKIQECGNLDLTGFDNLELEKMISFQNGDMFEKLTPDKPKGKPKETEFKAAEPKEARNDAFDKAVTPQDEERPAPPDEQVSFTLFGFVFTLGNSYEIQELKDLVSILKDAPKKDREDVNQKVFEEISRVITDKFMR